MSSIDFAVDFEDPRYLYRVYMHACVRAGDHACVHTCARIVNISSCFTSSSISHTVHSCTTADKSISTQQRNLLPVPPTFKWNIYVCRPDPRQFAGDLKLGRYACAPGGEGDLLLFPVAGHDRDRPTPPYLPPLPWVILTPESTYPS